MIRISAMPPAALMHARSLSKQLRSRFPEVNLIVGLCGARGDLNKAKERIGGGARTNLVAMLSEVRHQIGVFLQPHLLRTAKPMRTDDKLPVLTAHSDHGMKPHIDLGSLAKETP